MQQVQLGKALKNPDILEENVKTSKPTLEIASKTQRFP